MCSRKKLKKNATVTEPDFLKNYVNKKILWAVIALLIIVGVNILINKYAEDYLNHIAQRFSDNLMLTGLAFSLSEIFIGIFPAELFMMIYQSKATNDYFIIVFVLGIISSLCGFIAFLSGKYLKTAKIGRVVMLQKKFRVYGDLFIKYGWIIIILAVTTPLPFALISFIAGYFNFSVTKFLKIVIPVRIARFFISGFFIKYSVELL